jgi:hypothetical protein
MSVRAASTALGAAALLAILAIPPSRHAIASSHRADIAGALKPAMRPGWR